MGLRDYKFKEYIIKSLIDEGFKDYSPVQKEVFDNLDINKNLLVKSKTGSGKTHAFLIPIFNDLDPDYNGVFATIIAPTLELARQTFNFAKKIASYSGKEIRVKLYTGGSEKTRDLDKLDNSMPHIVIGTPGRIKDLAIDNNKLKIYTSKYFVIDEVDMVFEGGYEEEINAITSVLSNARFLFFSATISQKIEPYLKKYMTNTKTIELEDDGKLLISHYWIPIKHKERFMVLEDLLKCFSPYLCIIFINKKEDATDLYYKVSNLGYNACLIHGDVPPRERKKILNDINALKYQYIIATDLAARGIDILGVSHVINYELPVNYEFYIHRSGRTGRMEKTGVVYTLYDGLDDAYLNNLEKKGIKPEYFEVKNKELVPYKGRNKREERKKPDTDYYKKALTHIKLGEKKPGYKKKRKEAAKKLEAKLKKADEKNSRRRKRK